MVNPADVPSTDKEKKQKTDKVDSNKLARQLRSGNLEAIYTHNRDVLEDRVLLRKRRTLVKDLIQYKNRIKADLHFFGIEIPEQFNKNQSYWSKWLLGWLNELEFNRWSGTASFKILIEQVITLRKNLLEVNKKVRALSRDKYYQKREALLRTIPGIGPITATIILTEVDGTINIRKMLQKSYG